VCRLRRVYFRTVKQGLWIGGTSRDQNFSVVQQGRGGKIPSHIHQGRDGSEGVAGWIVQLGTVKASDQAAAGHKHLAIRQQRRSSILAHHVHRRGGGGKAVGDWVVQIDVTGRIATAIASGDQHLRVGKQSGGGAGRTDGSTGSTRSLAGIDQY
jgi:hypothetical protein